MNQVPDPISPKDMKYTHLTAFLLVGSLAVSARAEGDGNAALSRRAERIALELRDRYNRTPPNDRVWQAGLAACGLLGLATALERSLRLRKARVLPGGFETKFIERLREDRIDAGKATDFCELSPSPAARVALAVVKRWGRPAGDLERAATIASRIEGDLLKRNVATLRRIAWLAPLIGLLGALTKTAAYFQHLNPDAVGRWPQGVATALTPLIAGVAAGAIAYVLFDGLMGKIEKLATALDRLGAETADAVAMLAPPPPPTAPNAAGTPRERRRSDPETPAEAPRSTYQPHVYPGRERSRPSGYRPTDEEY